MTNLNDDPLLTIAILSYNRRDELRTTLEKIFGQEYARIEVIVVDNASTDGSADMVGREFPQAVLIRRETNIGIAGWNDALRIAQGEYLCVLDDDCHIEGTTIRASIGIFQSEDVDIVSYNVINTSTGISSTMFFPSGIFSFWGCAFMMRRSVIEKIGCFDENIFLYRHESEFMLRALRHGLKHRILLGEPAFHRRSPALSIYNQKKVALETYGLAYSYLKHLDGRQYLMMLFNFILDAFILYLRSIKKYHSWRPFPFAALALAVYRVHRLPARGSSFDARFILDNDVNCINPVRRLLLRKKSGSAEREYFCSFFQSRQNYYPDFNGEYFLRPIPFKHC